MPQKDKVVRTEFRPLGWMAGPLTGFREWQEVPVVDEYLQPVYL